MKRVVFLLITSVFFLGCQDFINGVIDSYLENSIGHMDLFYSEDFEGIETLEEIGQFLHDNIEYKLDPSNYAQSPEETWILKTGDCEDYALLFMNIAYLQLGVKPNLIYVTSSNMLRKIEEGGIPNHAMVEIKGIIYESQTGNIYTGDIQYIYYFNDVFSF